MTTKEIASICSVSDERIYQFAKENDIKPIAKNNWGNDFLKAYIEFLRNQILENDDPKIAKIIADTEKAKAETDLKRLDYEIKQKEYIKADLVENVLSDAFKALTKKVYELDKEVYKYSSLQEACDVLLSDLKLELLEKYKELDSNCWLEIE